MDRIKKILEKKVTRRQFLVLVALFIYSFSGLKNLLEDKKEAKSLNFGNGPYGGKRRS